MLNPHTYQVKVEWIKNKLYMLYNEYTKRSVGSSSSGAFTSQSQESLAPKICGVRRGGLRSRGGHGKLDETLISGYIDYRSKAESGNQDLKSNLDKYLEEVQMN
ncbi:PREDICTED: uncharacterized protein LOC109183409 [Ipomoea nil]|uniref:uncharacterized protein LOC109183409 n=1 Tax=Ipomoea nil TaxID=35883 RepID=UPI0009013F6E|nr:PREDICTED: uncharacterized protein LOC109183409 [Ipomoea nil]